MQRAADDMHETGRSPPAAAFCAVHYLEFIYNNIAPNCIIFDTEIPWAKSKNCQVDRMTFSLDMERICTPTERYSFLHSWMEDRRNLCIGKTKKKKTPININEKDKMTGK